MSVSDEFETLHYKLLPAEGAKRKAAQHADYVSRLLTNDEYRRPIKILQSGSFAKHTHIDPLGDLDLAVHYRLEDWATSRGLPPNPGHIIGAIKGRMEQALGHTAVVRAQRRSVGIVYANVKIDIVPALVEDTNTFDAIIPDRTTKKWVHTNIQRHIDFIKGQDRSYRPIAKTIRLMKAWKRAKAVRFPGFALELITVKALEQAGTSASLQNCVFRVFDYINTGQLKRQVAFNANYRIRDIDVSGEAPVVIVDPVNAANNVAEEVTHAQRDSFLGKAALDWRNSRLAIEAEQRGDNPLALRHWRAVFKDQFASAPRRAKTFLERLFS